VILEEGAYLQVSKVKKKKSLPTDPNFEDHAIGNTHIFLFGLMQISTLSLPVLNLFLKKMT
jgi:hypothetical protein